MAIAVLRNIFPVIQPPHEIFVEGVQPVKSKQVEVIVGSYYQELLAEGREEVHGEGAMKVLLKLVWSTLARFQQSLMPQSVKPRPMILIASCRHSSTPTTLTRFSKPDGFADRCQKDFFNSWLHRRDLLPHCKNKLSNSSRNIKRDVGATLDAWGM